MATRCPHATWDPLGPQTAHRMDRHDLIVLHTMAGPFDVVDTMFHANGYRGTESHFGIKGDGFAKQWQDLDFRADANNEGNHRCISIETADMGESFPKWGGSDVPAWTDAQLDKIVLIVRWLCDHYDIPAKLVPDTRPGRRGIAYHRQGIPGAFPPPFTGLVPGGELWTVLPGGRGKPCPGERRIHQTIDTVIPRVQGHQEDDFDMTPAERKALIADIAKASGQAAHEEINEAFTVKGSVVRKNTVQLVEQGIDAALAVDGELGQRLAAIEAKLDALTPEVPDASPPA